MLLTSCSAIRGNWNGICGVLGAPCFKYCPTCEYVRKLTSLSGEEKKRKSTSAGVEKETKKSKGNSDDLPHGFARGLKPEKIIGATDSSGQLMFLMKW